MRTQNADVAGANSVHINVQSSVVLPNTEKLGKYRESPRYRQTARDAMLEAMNKVGMEFNGKVRGAKGPEFDKDGKDLLLTFILAIDGTTDYFAFIDDMPSKLRKIETIFDGVLGPKLNPLDPEGKDKFKSATVATAVLTYPGSRAERQDGWTRIMYMLLILLVLLGAIALVN